jgi:hypothetical protein
MGPKAVSTLTGSAPLAGAVTVLDYLARAHDDDPIGNRQGLGLIVGDVDGREPHLLLQPPQLRAHFPAQFGVQIGERLIEQTRLGVAGDGAGDSHALLLAARKPRCRPLRKTRKLH